MSIERLRHTITQELLCTCIYSSVSFGDYARQTDNRQNSPFVLSFYALASCCHVNICNCNCTYFLSVQLNKQNKKALPLYLLNVICPFNRDLYGFLEQNLYFVLNHVLKLTEKRLPPTHPRTLIFRYFVT